MTRVRLHLTARGPAAAAGAHTNNNTHVYTVANPRIDQCELRFYDNGVRFATFTAAAANPYDFGNRRYRLENTGLHREEFLDQLRASIHHHRLQVELSFRATFYGFLRHVVTQMAYAAADTHNFADPADAGAILGTVTLTPQNLNPDDTQWDLDMHAYTYAVSRVPVQLTAHAAVGGSTVRLAVHLDLPASGRGAADQHAVMQRLVAADWSELFERLDPANLRDLDDAWQSNIEQYMLRYIPLDRGRGLIDRARALGLAASQAALANGGLNDTQRQQRVVLRMRNEIDRFLITANPWGQATNAGVYPQAVHTVLAVHYDSRWNAMPVRFLRRLGDNGTLDAAQQDQMAAQMGMGNCEEHSAITYRAVKALMQADGPTRALLRCVVRSGYANIDHAFVVGGEPPREVVDARCHVANHGCLGQGDRADIWDAHRAHAAGGGGHGREGWTCDPYLAAGEIAATFTELCQGERLRQWLDWKGIVYPAPLAPVPTWQDPDDPAAAGHIHVAGFCSRAPAVTAVAPNGGTTVGGTQVRVTGRHFDDRVSLRLDATAAPRVRVRSSRRLQARTPPHAPGAVGVGVQNPGKTLRVLANAFTYRAPTVTALDVDHGPVDGGTAVTITGTDFAPGAQVFFGGTRAAAEAFVDDTTMTATTPAHADGWVNVVVRNTDARQGTLPGGFRFNPKRRREAEETQEPKRGRY